MFGKGKGEGHSKTSMSAWLNSDLRSWNSEDGWGYNAGKRPVQMQLACDRLALRIAFRQPLSLVAPSLSSTSRVSSNPTLDAAMMRSEASAAAAQVSFMPCVVLPIDAFNRLQAGSPKKLAGGRDTEGGGAEKSRTPKKGNHPDGKPRREGGSRRARRWRGSQGEVPSEWLGCWSDGSRRGWSVCPSHATHLSFFLCR